MKKAISILLCAMLTLGLVACGSSGGSAQSAAPAASSEAAASTGEASAEAAAPVENTGKVYQWDWLVTSAGKTLTTEIAMDMAEEIKEATNGQLVITVRGSGEMPFAVSEYLQAVSDGSAAMADCLLSAISNDLSSGALIALPMLVNDFDELNIAMDVIDDKIESELGQFGVKMASHYAYPGQQVWGKGAVPETIKDLSGMKVRAQGSEQAAWLEMNGLVPMTINASEVTTSVSRGVIDGIVTAAQSLPGENWYEVVDWGYICNMQYIGVYICVNEDMLNELPDDVRETFLEIATRYANEDYPERIGAYDVEAKKECEDLGLTLVWASEEERAEQIEKIKEYWTKWCAEKGGTTQEDLDAILAALENK